MMRRTFLFLCLLAVCVTARAQTFAATNSAPTSVTNAPAADGVTLPTDIAPLYQAWRGEHDPAKRADAAQKLLDAIIRSNDDALGVVADEVTRDGLPQRLIAPSAAQKVALTPLTTLQGARVTGDDPSPTPVFRRCADDRVEAWTSDYGWLFNARGKLVTHVTVPRRDGDGREWFGAFLPDGNWITTDLWIEDKQINAFDAHGKWLWELQGADILKQMPREAKTEDSDDEPPKPLICWARADRIGRGWVVCVGENMNTQTALVSEDKTVAAIPAGQTDWDMVYPRAMGVRGFYTGLAISSDDAKLTLSRDEPAHGMYVGWPNYSLAPGKWGNMVRDGDWHFGFWPKSHALFVETEPESPDGQRVWFFDESGKYAGEIDGAYLADSAAKGGLLIQTPDDTVATVLPGTTGPTATQTRAFTWADGTRAVPLALYDDLHLGFFLRGPGITGPSGDARAARADADIVLAKW
jgi:hypothetical protein